MSTGTYRHPAHWTVAFERALHDQETRKKIMAATGYDDAKLDQVIAGNHGITIDLIEPVLNACGIVVMRKDVFDAYVVFAKIGAECALKGRPRGAV